MLRFLALCLLLAAEFALCAAGSAGSCPFDCARDRLADLELGQLRWQVRAQTATPEIIPSSSNLWASPGDGQSSSFTHFDLSDSRFHRTFNHERGSTSGDDAQAFAIIAFAVDQTVEYVLSGAYSAVDPGGNSIVFEVGLFDIPIISILFDTSLRSVATPNGSFVLGQTGGDHMSFIAGSTTKSGNSSC